LVFVLRRCEEKRSAREKRREGRCGGRKRGKRERKPHVILLLFQRLHRDLVKFLHLVKPEPFIRAHVVQDPVDGLFSDIPGNGLLGVGQKGLVVRERFVVPPQLERELRHLLERLEPELALLIPGGLVVNDLLEGGEGGIGSVALCCRG
jgi:hypothetical protein